MLMSPKRIENQDDLKFRVLEDQIDEDRIKFAKEVEEVTGYSQLRRDLIPDGLTTAQIGHNKIVKKLKSLDIFPLDLVSVERYKRKIAVAHWTYFTLMIVAIVAGVFCLLASLGLLIDTFVCPDASWVANGPWLLGLWLPLTIVHAALFVGGWWKHPGWHREWKWKMVSLHGYEKQVPDFALATCLTVSEKLNEEEIGHTWSIDSWEEGRSILQGDPFLVLRVSHTQSEVYKIYLEVWNEPKYTAKRLA